MKTNFFNIWHNQWQRSALRCNARKKFENFKRLQNLLKTIFQKTFFSIKRVWENETSDKFHQWHNIAFEFYLQHVAQWTHSDKELSEWCYKKMMNSFIFKFYQCLCVVYEEIKWWFVFLCKL